MKFVWKSAWIAAFALPILSTSPSFPQQAPATEMPAAESLPEAKAAAQDLVTAPVSSEEELRQALVGKQLFLRGLWLDDSLHFKMDGVLASNSPKGSFTLCSIEIEHVKFDKRHVELEGSRYGIHFEDEGNWSEQSASFDRIRVTPKKKHLEILIDRQQVIIPKKKKGDEARAAHGSRPATGNASAPAPNQQPAQTSADTPPTAPAPVPTNTASAAKSAQNIEAQEPTTQNPAVAAAQLEHAINKIFAPGLDASMIEEMPDYWQYFYKAQLDHKSIEPTDPSIVRPGPGVDGPKLLKNLVAASNDYAQKSQVAGVASYKVILGPDGKPIAVAVFRPIGFGLDENAVAAIQRSKFSPASKDGKASTSVIDVDVNFRIYSKLTSKPATPQMQDAADASANISPVTGKPMLPGLFTVQAATLVQQQ